MNLEISNAIEIEKKSTVINHELGLPVREGSTAKLLGTSQNE